jgi:hypothetical protein
MEGKVHAPIATSPIDAARGRGKHSPVCTHIRSIHIHDKGKTDHNIHVVSLYFSPKDLDENSVERK